MEPLAPAATVSKPACPRCHGDGFLRDDVPFGDPRLGQVYPCQCLVEKFAADRARRAQAASDAAPERAGCAFTAYDASDDAEALEAAQAWARDVAKGDTRQPWLFLFGDPGNGKTHLLGAAFYALLDAGKAPIYTVTPLLLDYIQKGIEAKGENEYAARFDAVRECPILILDDLGAEKRTEWKDERLFALIDYRYRLKLPLAVATNLRPDELAKRIGSRLQDQRLSRMVLMLGRDRRLA